MTHARCCPSCDKGDPCCELAGSRWENRYCLELPTCTYTAEFCDCSMCETAGATCEECNTLQLFCCREVEFSWCVRGPMFRYPPGIGPAICDPEQLDSVYDPCLSPWVAPDWGITERGNSSEYVSPYQVLSAFCTPCTAAGANNRVQYRVRLRCETVAGSGCTYTFEGVEYDYEDIDEVYTVEGVARLTCQSGSDGGCDGDQTYTHLLVIEPCGSTPAGQPAPPKLTYYATLNKNTPPNTPGVWNLWKVEFAFDCLPLTMPLTSGFVNCETFPSGCPTGYTTPCTDGQNAECNGCSGDALSMATLQVLTGFPCQDNPCTL